MVIGELLETIWQDSDVIRFALSWSHSSGCVEREKLEAVSAFTITRG